MEELSKQYPFHGIAVWSKLAAGRSREHCQARPLSANHRAFAGKGCWLFRTIGISCFDADALRPMPLQAPGSIDVTIALLLATATMLQPRVAPREWLRKKRSISREASGPFGSVYEPLLLPPDHACPAPCTTQCSATALPSRSRRMLLVYVRPLGAAPFSTLCSA